MENEGEDSAEEYIWHRQVRVQAAGWALESRSQ